MRLPTPPVVLPVSGHKGDEPSLDEYQLKRALPSGQGASQGLISSMPVSLKSAVFLVAKADVG